MAFGAGEGGLMKQDRAAFGIAEHPRGLGKSGAAFVKQLLFQGCRGLAEQGKRNEESTKD
jgi:hypothetical protein